MNKITFSEQCYYVFGDLNKQIQGLSLQEIEGSEEDTLGPLAGVNHPQMGNVNLFLKSRWSVFFFSLLFTYYFSGRFSGICHIYNLNDFLLEIWKIISCEVIRKKSDMPHTCTVFCSYEFSYFIKPCFC